MILPNKYIQEKESLIGVGAILLENLSVESSITVLWDNVKNSSFIGNYERFILGLDFLFILGLVDIKEDKIVKVIR